MCPIDQDLFTLSPDDLIRVSGGQAVDKNRRAEEAADRERWENGGGHVAEATVTGAGAAIGSRGGPPGAAAGAFGAELINRTGVPREVGRTVGGAAFDAMQFRERGYYK